MQHFISLSEDKSYVILKYVGEISREPVLKITEEAHRFGSRQGVKHYLVDVTEAVNVESLMGNYDFAYDDLDQADIDRSACIAMLVDPNDQTHDFVETLLINAGHGVRLFRDRETAIKYLHKMMDFKKEAQQTSLK